MAKVSFNISANYKELVALQEETKKLENALRSTNVALNQTKFEQLSNKVKENKARMDELVGSINKVSNSLSPLGKELGRVDAFFHKLGEQMKRSATQMTMYRLSYMGMNQALAVLQGIPNTIMQFEAMNSKLAAIRGTTKEGIKELTQSAEELGRTTVFTATQATQMQIELAKLGFQKNEILGLQDATLGFAQAVGTDLAKAAGTTGAVLRMFGGDVKDVTRYTGAMTGAVMNSALDFTTISENIAQVGPVAHSVGMEVEDVLALFGALKNAGVNGSVAATSLRNILNEMAGGKLYKQLGYQVRSLEDFIKALNDLQGAGYKGAEGVSKAMKAVGKRGGAQLLALANSKDSIPDIRDRIVESEGGAVKTMADTMVNNLTGSITMLKSAWEGFILSFRQSDGIVATVVNDITKQLRSVTEWMTSGGGDFNREQLESVLKLVKVIVQTYVAYKLIRMATNKIDQLNGRVLEAKTAKEQASIEQEIRLHQAKIDAYNQEIERLQMLKDLQNKKMTPESEGAVLNGEMSVKEAKTLENLRKDTGLGTEEGVKNAMANLDKKIALEKESLKANRQILDTKDAEIKAQKEKIDLMQKEKGITDDQLDSLAESGDDDATEIKAEKEKLLTMETDRETIAEKVNAGQQRVNNMEKKKGIIATQGSALSKKADTTATNVNTVSQKGNTTAVKGATLAQRLHTVGTKVATATMYVFNTAVNAVKNAFIALGTAIKTNPIGMALTAVTLLYSLFSQYFDKEDEAEQRSDEFGKSVTESMSEVRKLYAVLGNVNQDSNVYKDARNQLIEMMNQYGIVVDAEKASIDELIAKKDQLIAKIKEEAVEREKANQISTVENTYNSTISKKKEEAVKTLKDEGIFGAEGYGDAWSANLETNMKSVLPLVKQAMGQKGYLSYYRTMGKVSELVAGGSFKMMRDNGASDHDIKKAEEAMRVFVEAWYEANVAKKNSLELISDISKQYETTAKTGEVVASDLDSLDEKTANTLSNAYDTFDKLMTKAEDKKLKLDTSDLVSAGEEIKKVNDKIAELRKKYGEAIKTEHDYFEERKKLKELQDKLGETKDQKQKIKIEADIKDAEKKVKELEKKLKSLPNKKSISTELKVAKTALDDLKNMMEYIKKISGDHKGTVTLTVTTKVPKKPKGMSMSEWALSLLNGGGTEEKKSTKTIAPKTEPPKRPVTKLNKKSIDDHQKKDEPENEGGSKDVDENELKRQAKERAKRREQQAKYDELLKKQAKDRAKKQREQELSINQERIKAMRDGTMKTVAQIEQDYKKEDEAIEEWWSKLAEDARKQAEDLWNANPKNAKAKEQGTTFSTSNEGKNFKYQYTEQDQEQKRLRKASNEIARTTKYYKLLERIASLEEQRRDTVREQAEIEVTLENVIADMAKREKDLSDNERERLTSLKTRLAISKELFKLNNSDKNAIVNFLSDYGTEDEKILAIKTKYDDAIASMKAQGASEYEIRSQENKRDEEVAKVRVDSAVENIDWAKTFEGLGNIAKPLLEQSLKGLRELANSPEMKKASVQDRENLQQKIKDTELALRPVSFVEVFKKHGIPELLNQYTKEQLKLNKIVAQRANLYEQLMNAEVALQEAEENLQKVIAEQETNPSATDAQQQIQQAKDKVEQAKDNKEAIKEGVKSADSAINSQRGLVGSLKGQLSTRAERLKSSQQSLGDVLGFDVPKFIEAFNQIKSAIAGLKELNKKDQKEEDKTSEVINMGDATKEASDGLKKLTDDSKGLTKALDSAGLYGQIASAVMTMLDMLKEGIGTIISTAISSLFGAISGVLNNVLTGEFLEQIFGSLFSGVGDMFDSLSGGGFSKVIGANGNAKSVEKREEKIVHEMERLSKALDNLTEKLDESKGGFDSIQSASKAIEVAEKNQKLASEKLANRMSYTKSHHSNDLWLGRHLNDWGGYDAINELLGTNISSTQELYKLTPQQMSDIRANLGEWWDIFKESGDYNWDKYWEEYADMADNIKNLQDKLNEKLTSTTFDSMYDGFKSTLKKMSGSVQEFADNASEMIYDALLNNYVSNQFSDKIKGIYEDMAKQLKDSGGRLSQAQIDALKERYVALAEQAQDNAKYLAEITGYDDVAEQSGSTNSFANMSQETADAMEGRLTAIQIAVEGIRGDMRGIDLNTPVEALGGKIDITNNALTQTQKILASSLIELQKINDNTKTIIQPIQAMAEDINKIKKNTAIL